MDEWGELWRERLTGDMLADLMQKSFCWGGFIWLMLMFRWSKNGVIF